MPNLAAVLEIQNIQESCFFPVLVELLVPKGDKEIQRLIKQLPNWLFFK